jgi:hypothetical protein
VAVGEDLPYLVGVGAGRHRRGQCGHVIVDVPAQCGQIEPAFVAERLVQAAAMHAQVVDQVVDGRAVIAALREHLHGRVHDLVFVELTWSAHIYENRHFGTDDQEPRLPARH